MDAALLAGTISLGVSLIGAAVTYGMLKQKTDDTAARLVVQESAGAKTTQTLSSLASELAVASTNITNLTSNVERLVVALESQSKESSRQLERIHGRIDELYKAQPGHSN